MQFFIVLAAVVGAVSAFHIQQPTVHSHHMPSNVMRMKSDQSSEANVLGRRQFLQCSGAAAAGVFSAGTMLVSASSAIEDDVIEGTTIPEDKLVTSETGLKYLVVKEGEGAFPFPGQTVKVHYTGWLNGFDTAFKFDSSYDRRRPFTFQVGNGNVIKGWDEAVIQMKVGEKRRLIIPPELGYGKRGAGRVIPPDSTLYFDVELLGLL
uniref:peptidylprolyl isomerase n=1 Tax=Fibrocapsa japonica TaxID=94617 RepID=A0A7S2Y1B3_9STRA|mmetsp:Transcript_21402/g.31028  ORF Transcript_21402/g.31028 Transcript_21402/m.31028 type:complete len:207 (+) Transcript_21402:152-772(+)|eukprot:CAMPEP_0113933728 /NCGR_PEP_ID=MMETSP1339-20121228/1037_1 /TAXON_ID=94617 /ORGANISM="Fibrocapsa japonica" /LENGTH=206 /DNA_ID=CAMNT_0000935173 /DNA_START=151 /DNA_END=771 /DNA_ORIENTATION=+ /assembly_acc=CAM_ASM_000762